MECLSTTPPLDTIPDKTKDKIASSCYIIHSDLYYAINFHLKLQEILRCFSGNFDESACKKNRRTILKFRQELYEHGLSVLRYLHDEDIAEIIESNHTIEDVVAAIHECQRFAAENEYMINKELEESLKNRDGFALERGTNICSVREQREYDLAMSIDLFFQAPLLDKTENINDK